jgi:hypothetical protein
MAEEVYVSDILFVLILVFAVALIGSLALNLLLGVAVVWRMGRNDNKAFERQAYTDRVPLPVSSHIIDVSPEDMGWETAYGNYTANRSGPYGVPIQPIPMHTQPIAPHRGESYRVTRPVPNQPPFKHRPTRPVPTRPPSGHRPTRPVPSRPPTSHRPTRPYRPGEDKWPQ